MESEWKRYSSSQSDKKTLAFEYEFSFSLFYGMLSSGVPEWETEDLSFPSQKPSPTLILPWIVDAILEGVSVTKTTPWFLIC